jgi:hypothetical protein
MYIVSLYTSKNAQTFPQYIPLIDSFKIAKRLNKKQCLTKISRKSITLMGVHIYNYNFCE